MIGALAVGLVAFAALVAVPLPRAALFQPVFFDATTMPAVGEDSVLQVFSVPSDVRVESIRVLALHDRARRAPRQTASFTLYAVEGGTAREMLKLTPLGQTTLDVETFWTRDRMAFRSAPVQLEAGRRYGFSIAGSPSAAPFLLPLEPTARIASGALYQGNALVPGALCFRVDTVERGSAYQSMRTGPVRPAGPAWLVILLPALIAVSGVLVGGAAGRLRWETADAFTDGGVTGFDGPQLPTRARR